MPDLELVLAAPAHLDACMRIIEDGKKAQIAAGFSQWSREYPNRKIIEQDIHLQQGWLVRCDANICAYFCLTGEEPLYESIQGIWKLQGPYRTLHRLAVANGFYGQGLGKFAVDCACNLCRKMGFSVIRTDTAENNLAMRKLLQKAGFTFAGTLPYEGLTLVCHEKFV